MSTSKDTIRLKQEERRAQLFTRIPITEMITVYEYLNSYPHFYSRYPALIPAEQKDAILSSPNWDLHIGQGLPHGCISYSSDGDATPHYLRYTSSGIEPLVFSRDFGGVKEDYLEINEEFRLFHNLYHNVKDNKYIKINDTGDEEIVAIVESNRIRIRLKELRQFLAVKEMYLSIQFDYREYSLHDLKELDLSSNNNIQEQTSHSNWEIFFASDDYSGYKSFSLMTGKYLIAPLPKSQSGVYGFAEDSEKEYVNFITKVDFEGKCSQQISNPDTCLFLTPVHFKKDVLDKYFSQPSKYSVEDGVVRCGYLWCLPIDNHHPDKVCAYLGDLGRLPHEVQLYWRSFNIPPVGGISAEQFTRDFMAQACDSRQVDHQFQYLYKNLLEACETKLGWQILLPLDKGDAHHLSSLRVPASEEQKEFDELILSLTKILIDSLNEKKLNALIPSAELNDTKGSISRLEKALVHQGAKNYENSIQFLRNLQDLRSSGAAHRKGTTYKKKANIFALNSRSTIKVFEDILREANQFIEYMISCIDSGIFSQSSK